MFGELASFLVCLVRLFKTNLFNPSFLLNFCCYSFLGFGTTHKVNNIILQPGSFGEVECNPSPKKRRCRRSLKEYVYQQLPIYISGKRIGSSPLAFNENYKMEFLLADEEKVNLIWVLCRSFSIPQHIPSWTGFRIAILNRKPVKDTSIGYLDCTDAPATDIYTVYHILERCLQIKDALNLQTVVCVFDQAIYCKVMEIKWKQPERCQSCIVMLGIFHTIMFLGIIGKRFGDAGLRDLLIQSGVLAEGSVDRALSGKQCNRSVR